MKHCSVLFFALMGLFCAANATTYYSQGSLSPNNLSSWNSNRLGAGGAPASFTNAGDQFVIQVNHVLYTSSAWTIGAAGSVLKIENGGVLHATFPILLTGTFQILNGAFYYHDNTGPVTNAAGSSIFGGTETFEVGSNFEIRNWINNTTPLPASVNWGNLIINYNSSIGGDWNQQGTLNNVQGNLLIKKTGSAGQSFRLTNNSGLILNIGGNLEVDQAILYIKEGNGAGTTSVVQVNGDISVNDGILDLGTVDLRPNNELRFKGNLLVTGTGSITAQTTDPMLVANSGTVQAVSFSSTLNTGLKIATGTMIKLNSTLSLGNVRPLVVAGTLNAGVNPITLNGGVLAVSGGKFSSNAKVNMKDGSCQVCQGNGSFSFSPMGWCATTGDTGIINFSTDTMLFNRSLASSVKIGAMNSKGKFFLTNQAVISFTGPLTGPFPNRGSIELTGNGTFSFDEYSRATGDAFYNGNGGWLITGSESGLESSSSAGSIQVTGTRNYNVSGVNNFEFKSSLPQFTGNAFPANISGTLKVNNSNISGLTMNNAITITSSGTLHLANGIIKTGSSLLTMNNNSTLLGGSANSYVDGSLKKIGNQNFTFHVGKLGRYSPLVATGGASPASFLTVDYIPGDPKAFYGNILSQLIEKISSVEYWKMTGTNGEYRRLKFKITPYSGVNDFSSLVISFHDGTGWINFGNNGTTGTVSNGTIEVDALNYGPLTLASTNFETNPFSSSLPVNFTSFTARRNSNQGILNWEVSSDTDADYYEVMTSSDNRNFTPVAKINAVKNVFQYQFIDNALKLGTNYYRIRAVEKSGNSLLSKIAALFYEKSGLELISLMPSVARQQTTVSIASSGRSIIQLSMVDAHGRLVKLIQANLGQGTNSIPIDLSGLSAGIYYISAVSNEGRSNVLRLLKQ